MPGVTFKIASTDDEIKMAKEIRSQVFVLEQGIAAELDTDGDDEQSIHLLAMEVSTPIGTGRLTIHHDCGVLSRISILAPYRKNGIGKLILAELELIAKERGVHTLSLTAHTHLEDFYTALGFKNLNIKKMVSTYTLITMAKAIQ